MRIETTYSIGEVVTISAIEDQGRVRQICVDSLGISYEVTYWINGERKTTWLREDEIRGYQVR